ncbi:MAG: PAC2 family protein [Ilumatobacteraceae bacterium]
MNAPYELHSSYTELPKLESPVLVVMMTGWIDAGSAAANAMAHLAEVTSATTLLTFDADEFIDFRARRPLMELRDGVSTRLVWAAPEMMRGRDANGRDVLLLTGTEPDSRWNAFSKCVGDLAVQMGVRQMFGLGAYPFALPHTRAVNISVTTPSSEWIANMPYLRSSVDVPAGVAAVLEHVLAGRGIASVGLWAQVPHYATTMPYPAASAALLSALRDSSGLAIDVKSLDAEAVRHRERLDQLVAANPEHQAMLEQLQAAFDAAHAAGTEPARIPSGDELAAQFEQFLREQGPN